MKKLNDLDYIIKKVIKYMEYRLKVFKSNMEYELNKNNTLSNHTTWNDQKTPWTYI